MNPILFLNYHNHFYILGVSPQQLPEILHKLQSSSTSCFAECPELASPWWRPASSCKCATAAAKASLADPCAGPRALPCLLDLAIPTCLCALDCTAQEPPMCKRP